MLEQITNILLKKGYEPVDEEVQGLLFRNDENQIYVVTLSYASQEDDVEEYIAIQRRMEFMLATQFGKKVECLHLVLAKDGMFGDSQRHLLDQLENVWLIASDTGKVYVFERQITEFDGLFVVLEGELKRYVQHTKKTISRVTPVNAGIIAINLLVYVAIIVINRDMLAVYDTDVMLSMGAMSYETVMQGAWYQLITSMFLHFGMGHLGNNMLLLAYTGYELEKRIGSIPYLFIYLGSGLLGNIASLIYYHGQGEYVVSAGASGAIYGVIGALLVTLIMAHKNTRNLSPNRIVVMIVITIYHGMTSTGVDNAAHIGGLLAGILGGILLSKILRYGKLEEVIFMR